MTDLLGPASANNAVTTRLAESRVFGSTDSWFKPCSSPASQDGTQVQAAFLNGMLAQLRAAVRGNGNLASGGGPVVPETNTNDGLLLTAIEYLIQRGQLTYAADQGVANAVVANLSPAPPELPVGFTVFIKMAAAPTGATTFNLNGSGTLAVQRRGAQALVGGEWAIGDVVPLVRTAAGWQIEGLTPADIPAKLHIGEDISPNAGLVSSFVSPGITAYQQDHVYSIGVANTCNGPTSAVVNGLPARPITRNDGTALQANDWIGGARLLLDDDGTSLRLVDLTVPQILALVVGATTINTTTQTYIDKSTPRGSTKLGPFTGGEVESDITSTGYTIVQTTPSFSGSTYVDASATCAIRDLAGSGSEGGGTARLILTDLTAGGSTQSEYVGGGAYTTNTQVPLVVPRVIFDLNPAHAYTLSLALQKGSVDGQVEVYDAYIFAQFDGTSP